MRKTLHKYFIPHHTNDYRPHFLRNSAIHFMIFLAVMVFIGSFSMRALAQYSGLRPVIMPDVLVSLANKDRISNNLSPLSVNSKLVTAATLKSSDMAANQYFAHTSPQGATPWSWFKKAGYKFLYAGENLAIDFTDSAAIENAWMNSPGHRANILSTNFDEIGIAVTDGVFEGKDTIYVVQMFGRPAATAVTAPVTPPVVPTTAPVIIPVQPTPTTTPIPTQVMGATAETAPLEEKEPIVEIVKEDSQFMEVKNTDTTLVPAAIEAVSTPEVTWAQKFFVYPSNLMKIIYLTLGGLILLAMILHIFIEIKQQHVPSLMYGSLVLLLMTGLYVMFNHFFGVTTVLI